MRTSDRVWRFVWRYLTPFIAAFAIFFAGSSVGPAWRAHEGGGKRGFVTVTDKSCSPRDGCDFTGDFISSDGRDRRSGVGLATGFSNLAVGVRVVAVDTGDSANVFPPGGGSDWILTSLFLAGAIGALLAWIYLVAMGRGHRRDPGSARESRRPEDGPARHRALVPASALLGPQAGQRFTLVRLREGYAIDEVEAFLERAQSGSVTSSEVQRVRFTPVRLRYGYDMGEVDNYLDALAAQLRAAGR